MKNKPVKKSEVVTNKGDAAQGAYKEVHKGVDVSDKRHAETTHAKKKAKDTPKK